MKSFSVITAAATLIGGAVIAQASSAQGLQPPFAAYEEHAAATTKIFIDVEYAGMGGPLEDEMDYPPCRRGPGDDRCIQLYEPGVTGAGD